jgi:hypothetical protein
VLRALELPLTAAAAGCLLGAGLAWCLRARASRPSRHGVHAAGRDAAGSRALRCVAAGLACAAIGLLLARAAGPDGSPAELAAAYALLAGGLAAALGASIAEAPAAGAMTGLSLVLMGVLTGYMAAAAFQIRLVGAVTEAAARAQAAVRVPAVTGALTATAGTWELAAGAAAGVAAAAALFIGRARRGKGAVPVRG